MHKNKTYNKIPIKLLKLAHLSPDQPFIIYTKISCATLKAVTIDTVSAATFLYEDFQMAWYDITGKPSIEGFHTVRIWSSAHFGYLFTRFVNEKETNISDFGENTTRECRHVKIPPHTQMSRYMGMCCSNGSLFHKKFLNMGPIFNKNIRKNEFFVNEPKNYEKWAYISRKNPKSGILFFQNDPLK